jgi:cell wall-associated NlpC family hydrolase
MLSIDWQRYVGLPFLSGGRSYEAVDCWGLVRLVFREVHGIELPGYGDIDAYALVKVAREMERGMDGEVWHPVQPGEVRPFDVCAMHLPGGSRVGHVGLMIGRDDLLHAEEESGSVIVPLTHFSVRERIACFRRHHMLT